uniref:F-box domain-containing protein n=1 Tax=Anopheles funestus TaxID=62324 RepID=A0A182R218_ANOFN
MNILDLPNEMLVKVASFLPVKDLKSLSLTCHRFNDLAVGPVLAVKGVLWLNKVEETVNTYGEKELKKQYIDYEVLKKIKRNYHAVGIYLPVDLSSSEFVVLYRRLMTMFSMKKIIRDLHVVDSNKLHMATLYKNCSALFQTLVGLSVTVVDSPIVEDKVMGMDMPSLRWIKWNEEKFHSNMWENRCVLINLTAPKLQQAKFEMPDDMHVTNQNYRSILALKTVDQLQDLECVLGDQVVELLTNNRLPALKRLHLILEECSSSVSWDIIASNTPNLEKLKLKRNPTVIRDIAPLCSFLLYCSALTELHLEGMDISRVIEKTYLWNGIETLHLHDCFACVQRGKKVVFHLQNVRKCCASIGLTRQCQFVFDLPRVEELSLSKGNGSLDILEMPKLRTLHLGVMMRRQMTFLTSEMPALRTLILDTPSMFLPVSESNYSLLLGSGVKLTNLTVICRSAHAINELLENVNRLQPGLATLKLIGMGAVSRISRTTLRSILKLPQLKCLLMTNIQLTAAIDEPYALPRDLQRLRIRSVYTPVNSRFISMKRNQYRLGNVVERKILHHNLVNANTAQVPNYHEMHSTCDTCIDRMSSLLPDA